MLATPTISLPSSSPTNIHGLPTTTKRKRKPAGTPDPDAEVVYLSPSTLMESDRYVCEVCNLSFQREQNLQMHRRRHKLPWSLHKSDRPPHEAAVVRKRVYVCPEPSCAHHDPAHALGDLVGIKKHFRRKHSNQKKWVCERCSKGYAVQSDYKAHLKTCGTRGHSCDCGRVFSRVETFIEHQDSCKARRKESGDWQHPLKPPSPFLPPPSSFMKPTFNLNLTTLDPHSQSTLFSSPSSSSHYHHHHHHTLELRELFPSKKTEKEISTVDDDGDEGEDQSALLREVARLKSETKELMRVAMEQKAKAAEKRNQARLLMEMANQDMERASKIREEALLTEIRNAQLQKDGSTWQMLVNGGQRKVTCDSCKMKCSKEFQESSSAQQVKEMVGHGISCFPKVNYYFPSPITHGENGDNSLTFRSLRLE